MNSAITSILVSICLACACGGRQNDLLQELEGKRAAEGLTIGDLGYGFVVLYSFDGQPLRTVRHPRAFSLIGFSSSGHALVGKYGEALTYGLSLEGDVLWVRRTVSSDRFGAQSVLVSADGNWVATRESRIVDPPPGAAPGQGATTPTRYRIGQVIPRGPDLVIDHSPDDDSETMGWSPDGEELVYSLEREVRIHNRRTGKHRVLMAGLNPTWSPDGRWIAYQPREGKAALRELETGRRIDVLPGEEVVYGMHWSPDSQYLLLAKKHSHQWGDNALVVYRLRDGANVIVTRLYDRWTNRDMGWVIVPPKEKQQVPPR